MSQRSRFRRGGPDTRARRGRAAAIAVTLLAVAVAAVGGAVARPWSGAAAPVDGSVGTVCAEANDLVATAQDSMAGALAGTRSVDVADGQITTIVAQVRALAAATDTDVLRDQLDRLAENLELFRAAITVGPGTGEDTDALAARVRDAVGGFRQTCLVGNGSFETGLWGWGTTGPTIALASATGGHSGRTSAVVSNTARKPALCGLLGMPSWVPATRRTTYQVTLWARAESGRPTLTLRVRELAGASVTGAASVSVGLSTSWQPVTIAYTPKAPGSSSLDVAAFVTNAGLGPCFSVDDVALTWG